VLKRLCAGSGAKTLSEGCVPTKEGMKAVIETMSKGGSIAWLDAFEAITGSRKLDATAMLEYYEPLMAWLENSNQHERLTVGWESPSGKPFEKAELPELKNMHPDSGSAHGFGGLGDAPIAFPGGSCMNGQECLLDSVCNGTICVCKEGLHTLQIADTYNCVPGDPRDAGFEDGSGGLIIALTPKDGQKNATAEAEMPDSTPGHGGGKGGEKEERKVHGNSGSRSLVGRWALLASVIIPTLAAILVTRAG